MTRVMARLALPMLVDRIVYATITVMSTLIIYDGWQQLELIDVVGVIVGPIVAMFVAHVFSASARRSGVAGWRALADIGAELVGGVIVLLLQVALQPGKAFSGGAAIG